MESSSKFFILLSSFFQIFFIIKGNSFNITLDELSIGKPKIFMLESRIMYIIEIKGLFNVLEKVPPRISLKCEDCNEDNPLLIVLRENKEVMSWELPLVIKLDNYHLIYKTTERTLCPFNLLNTLSSSFGIDNHPVTISLSTSITKNVSVEVVVNLEKNFVIDLKNNISVQVTPSTPAFYLYDFEAENVTSVLLHITSEDDICLIVSVQNRSCPVFDLEENVGYKGYFETVTRQGGLTVTKESFPNGFYVVLIVTSEDKFCSNKLLNKALERKKNVVISVSKTISSDKYKLAVGATLLIIVVFCIAMFIIFHFSMKRGNKSGEVLDEILINVDIEASTSASQNLPYVTSPISVITPVTPVPTTPGDTLSVKTDSSLDETDFDLVDDAESDKNIFRQYRPWTFDLREDRTLSAAHNMFCTAIEMKGLLYLCDLARKNQSILKKKSELYFWNLLTVGIFYFLPVFQLVFTEELHIKQSGRVDLCYYNFLCSHPLWWFSDFNHMFSNVGYISFGALFMFLTLLKKRDYEIKISANKKLYKFYGIPQHFGIFYAMGTALIIEGVMSICYHICPNHYNFQFDSSFMYVICTLCIIKIYQTRHPDINASAYTTFSLLAGVVVLGMCGVFNSNLIFWILFTIMHLSLCIYVSLQIYYIGRFKLEFISFVRWFKELQPCRSCHLQFFRPMFPTRFALLAVANACNWALAFGSFIYEIKNFSSYLLAIFMVNLMLYIAFYILMKFICKERLPLQSFIYILLAMLFWSAALYFFLNKTISWKLTPAASKLYNQKCTLLDFYDSHDIWHFISAAAMFFSFMEEGTSGEVSAHVTTKKEINKELTDCSSSPALKNG